MPHINFTGRKRILRGHVIASLNDGTRPGQFTVRLQLDELKIPTDALVFVEAYRGTVAERFDLGTLSASSLESVHQLDFLKEEPGILLRVAVVGRGSTGMLLASGESIPFRSEGTHKVQRRELLPVVRAATRPLSWWLDFTAVGPRLCLNSNDLGWDQAIQDAHVRALIFPAIVESIIGQLRKATANDPDEDADESDSAEEPSWVRNWMTYFDRELGFTTTEVLTGDVDTLVDQFAMKYAIAPNSVLDTNNG